MEIVRQLGIFVSVTGVLGLCSHWIGEALPRRWFHPDRFPYALCKWEQNGRFYRQKLKIERWKNKLPDKSQKVASMVKKSVGNDHSSAYLLRLTAETCVSEAVHWVLLLCSPVYLACMEQPLSIVAAVGYALSHLPFIVIQRYNRPRLLRAAAHAKREEAYNETAGSVEQ